MFQVRSMALALMYGLYQKATTDFHPFAKLLWGGLLCRHSKDVVMVGLWLAGSSDNLSRLTRWRCGLLRLSQVAANYSSKAPFMKSMDFQAGSGGS